MNKTTKLTLIAFTAALLLTAKKTKSFSADEVPQAESHPAASSDKNEPSKRSSAEKLWLSSFDLAPIRQGWGQPQADKSVVGKPMAIAGRAFTHGIGTHATSEFSIELGGAAKRFSAWVGIDDSAEGKGSVAFHVLDDQCEELWTSGLMRGGMAAKQVDLDLTGKRWITLLVDDGGDQVQFDHADWGDAVLTMSSGKPRIVNVKNADPIAELPIAGKSNARLAMPVTLPYEKTLPGPIGDWMLLTADGIWGQEYMLKLQRLGSGGFHHASRSGRACNDLKAWCMLANRRTGQGLAMMLAYMGNWTLDIVPDGQEVKVRLATTPADLKPFVTIQGLPIPGALVAEFTGHWDYGAQPIVRFMREKLVRDLGPQWPLVQYNSWYDTAEKISQQQLFSAAKTAADVGAELFTVDAGWYGDGASADWSKALGDWRVNRARLPDGLEAVAAEVRRLGMRFGLWFEIECADPSSPLAKAHPDWFLTDRQGNRIGPRDMLDFGKPEALEHVKGIIDDFMAKYKLDYIKMDFNTDPRIENDSYTQADDPLYRHYRGLAELWTSLRAKYPALVIENCASGSLRQELMSVAHTDTHWVSDNIDNRANLQMAFSANYLMPPSINSHWTTQPNPNDAMLDLDAQFAVNMLGHFGMSGKIAAWDAETLAAAKARIAEYKRIRPVIRSADVFHLTTQGLGRIQAALYADATSGRSLLFAFHDGDPQLQHILRLRGLDPNRSYRLKEPLRSVRLDLPGSRPANSIVPGKDLIEQGLTITFPHSGAAAIVELEPLNDQKNGD
jgi:alpha-galactosidase